MDAPAKNSVADTTGEAVDRMLHRIEQSLGGYRAPGRAILARTNELVDGTYAFAGPDAFFRTAGGDVVGTVRAREGAIFCRSFIR